MGMDYDEFQASSYFDQRKQSSILSMSPADQLLFIETFAFGKDENKDNHTFMKSKIKEHSITLEKEYNDLSSQHKLITNQILECQKKAPSNKNSLSSIGEKSLKSKNPNPSTLNVDDVKKRYSEIMNSLNAAQSRLTKKIEALGKLTKKDEELKKAEDERRSLENQLKNLIDNRSRLGIVKSEEDIQKLMDESTSLKEVIKHIQDSHEADKLQLEFEEMSNTHYLSLKKKIELCNEKIMNDDLFTKNKNVVRDYDSDKKKYDDFMLCKQKVEDEKIVARTELEKIRSKIEEDFEIEIKRKGAIPTLQKFIKMKIQELESEIEKYKLDIQKFHNQPSEGICPNKKCKSRIHIVHTPEGGGVSLIPYDKNLVCDSIKLIDIPDMEMFLASSRMNIDYLTNAETSISDISSILRSTSEDNDKDTIINKPISFEELQLIITQLNEHSVNFNEKIRLEDDLKNKVLPAYILKVKNQMMSKRKGVPKNFSINQTESEIQNKIKSLDSEVEKSWEVRSQHSKLSREISKLENSSTAKRLLKTEKVDDVNPIITLQKECSDISLEVTKLAEDLTKSTTELHLAESYNLYLQHTNEMKSLTDIEIDLSEKIRLINDRIKGVQGLYELAIQAEFLSLTKTINCINEHAKPYLASMFESPIVAKLQIKRVTKQGNVAAKPSIEIQIAYDGNIYNDIDELCGSERQRCDLAFLFGVNDMLNSKILLLDECMNNMDSEMNMEVLSYINDFKADKQILMISHEAIHGVFDKVIRVVKQGCCPKGGDDRFIYKKSSPKRNFFYYRFIIFILIG